MIDRFGTLWCVCALLLSSLSRPVVTSAQGTAPARPSASVVRERAHTGWTQPLDADTLFFAEGVDADPRSGALYVTSIRYGAVRRLDADGGWHDVLASSNAPLPAVYGVAVDTLRDVLWLATGPHARRAPAGTGDPVRDSLWTEAALYRVGLANGMVEQRWTLGAAPALPGELTVSPSGEILVSDGLRGLLYRVQPETGQVRVVRSASLRSPQGIAVADDWRVAWVADWSRGLLRWDLLRDELTPVPGPDGQPIRGLDGLRRDGAWLIAIQNGAAVPRVIAARLDGGGTRIEALHVLDTAPEGLGEPTVGVVQGREFVYVVSSQWPFWTDAGERRGSAPLPAVSLRRVPMASLRPSAP